MSNTQYAHGPWLVAFTDGEDVFGGHIVPNADAVEAERNGSRLHRDGTFTVLAAPLSLALAAPDLLAALRALIPFVCAGAADHEVGVARAAIARAEGRTP